MNIVKLFFPTVLLLAFANSAAWAGAPNEALYLDGGASKVAVILSHGRGGGPDAHVVGPLRKAIHSELGFHTLSLQLPNAKKNAKKYPADFPQAYATMKEGVEFLRKEKGADTINLMGYSMGSRMATAFLAEHPELGITGFIGVGVRNGKGTGGVLDSLANLLRAPTLPIFDVWGTGGDGKDAKHAKFRSVLAKRGDYQTHVIEGATHSYDGYEDTVNAAVIGWLKSRH
jgi:hypothetical protein